MSTLSFPVLKDAIAPGKSMPAFMVSESRGFLPREDPIVNLPSEFDAVERLLSRMPCRLADGSTGLLAQGQLGDCVLSDLPDLTWAVDKYADDLPLMNALYRDYSFLASAYLLEPCHLRFLRGNPYGLGRERLPANIAKPIARSATIIGFKPFMEYAGSYALFNYKQVDPNKGLEYSNLRLIRAFENGLDPSSSEAGFVLVHVDMVQHSGPLVAGAAGALDAAAVDDRADFDSNMEKVLRSMTLVNNVMEKMWEKSRPNDYTSFRTFIFGITSQSMFPNGVIYEGVSDEPLYFRGESGANDSMIPLCDNLLQLKMPDTPLTEILKDFRSYRPGNHREFLEFVKFKADAVGLADYALGDVHSAALYVKVMNQVRDFRWRHWCFTREYILKKTAHPTATGGSPIVTWLPNQLQAVLDRILSVRQVFADGLPGCEDLFDLASRQKVTLQKEVRKYCQERAVGS